MDAAAWVPALPWRRVSLPRSALAQPDAPVWGPTQAGEQQAWRSWPAELVLG